MKTIKRIKLKKESYKFIKIKPDKESLNLKGNYSNVTI